MNKKMKIRVIVGSILVALSITTGVYSYLQLTNRELGADVNLFSLVPESSIAILETNNVTELMESMDQLSFTHQYDSLEFSDLLNFLKKNIDILKANTAHGLSSQMNQMLISFHGSETPKGEVLYGKLATGDEALIENIFKRNSTDAYPAKTFKYRGETIRIYPINNEDFLACYFKPGFYAVSYQKKLIEDVIDAHLYKKSILNDSIFTQFLKNEKSYSSSSLYIKGENIPLGKSRKENGATFHLSRWTAFNINMKGDAIYLSGSCLDNDTSPSFENMLKSQEPIEIYPSKYLPAATSFFYQMAISDFGKAFTHISKRSNQTPRRDGMIERNDSLLRNFLINNGGDELRFLIFHESDTSGLLRKLMSVGIKDISSAETGLNRILENVAKEKGKKVPQKTIRIKGKEFKIFVLPENSIFAQFSSNPDNIIDTYGCFYNGDLLVTPDDSCIYSYIRQIEENHTMEGNPVYEKCISGLSSESNYLSVADMETAVLHPEIYGQLMPSFFFKHHDFFRNFILTIQFTCVNQKIYPYVVLMYKGKKDQQDISIPSKAN